MKILRMGGKKLVKESMAAMLKSVMIDAGHGGRDPGAINKQLGFKEKDIVLKVAEYLAFELIESYPNIVPFLTRKEDEYISLKERCAKADCVVFEDLSIKPADIFLSVHTNARLLKGKYGLEIETYHYRGSVLGKKLASVVQKNLVAEGTMMNTIDRGVKTALFYVLRRTRMPAVLVELGFLSDLEEAIILSSDCHQKKMGKILAKSINEFFREQEENINA